MDQIGLDGGGHDARAELARCRMLLTAAIDGVIITRDGVVIDVTEQLTTMSGYTREELIGRTVTDFVVEECRDAVRQRQANAVEGTSELGIVLKGGGRREVEVVTRIDVIDGRPSRISLLRDVTERKQSHDSLRDTERRLDAVARLARVGYWEDDVGRNRLSWSREACTVIGLPSTDRGCEWSDFKGLIHPDDWPLVQDARARVLQGEPPRTVRFRTTVGDTTRHVEIVAEAIRDSRGQITRVVGAIQDVSDREAATAVLRASEERLQLALRATGLGPWDWDLLTNQVEFWPEWKRQIGYEPHEIANKYEEWESRLHPDDRQLVLKALREYLEGRTGEYVLEFRLRHKNGEYRWIYTRGVVLRDAGGKPTRMIGCHLDITERRQLEEQYRQSQKMQAIGQLAGGIAHDFNNLLVVINGYAELIGQELGPDHGSHRDLEHIRAAAASAANLTRQLLAFSRRQILQPQVLDPNQALRSMRPLLDRAVRENITIVMTLAATGRVTADRGQLEQVMLNLAVNARDAMPNGGTLTVETADVELDTKYAARHRGSSIGRHVLITVTDTGTGMDEETRAHVFEPFFTTKSDGHGTGLGLATVYGIVRQSGGSIRVDSELGKGTVFRIYLPVAATAAAPPPAPTEMRDLRGVETALVLEDQADVRALIVTTLRRYGYSVLVAANGTHALAAVRSHRGPVHLMLADVVLPGTSGREVTRQVVAEYPSMRVLYMSGYTDDAIHHHGVLEPGLAFIHKPFTSETLMRKIREVLDAQAPPRH